MIRWSSDFWRLFAPTALMSLVLAALCAGGAIYLYRQQTISADVLGENIVSRQAAGDLEETLHDMIALHREQATRVEPLLGSGSQTFEQTLQNTPISPGGRTFVRDFERL